MATAFKTLLSTDVQSARTKLHEAIPITGTILSGTYTLPAAPPAATSEENIKNYTHGMFQSVYDYPYLSSSANHILDVTVGYASGSEYSSSASDQNSKKIQMYNQMAQVLVGFDTGSNVREFDEDGDLGSGAKLKECYFFNFARLLTKDEIQKGTFYMDLSVDPTGAHGSDWLTNNIRISDVSGSTSYKVNSPAGEYNILYITSSTNTAVGTTGFKTIPNNGDKPCGLIYYQAGIVVLTSSIFKPYASGGLLSNNVVDGGTTLGKVILTSGSEGSLLPGAGGWGISGSFMSSSISGASDAIRSRVQNVYFANTTELNSTVYFCRANANEFNYSANPTYLSSSKIRVKETRTDEPISYLTTIGLYGANNELLATAKLSEPLKKTPATEFTLRVRLDY
jgi:hypothetical protein